MHNRRNFLKTSLAGAVSLVSPAAFSSMPLHNERRLKFYNLHTGEKLTATYWSNGEYILDELSNINRLLRDHRSGEITSMDNALLDLLYYLQLKVDKTSAYHVISGYRSPKTNAQLRYKSKGVAKRSLHMQGKAIDVRLPGVELKQLRKAALDLRLGGVGFYPKSDFIHIDTGRPRFW